MLNILLLVIAAAAGWIIGMVAHARAEGDGSAAVMVFISVLFSVIIAAILFCLLAFGASGDTTSALRWGVALVAYVASVYHNNK